MIEHLFGMLSENIWDRIKDSIASGIRQGEESITDNILLEIYRAKLKGIHTIHTPKITESITGCDWEWWIGSEKKGWYRYAIQAKKVRSNDGYYPSLNHTVGSGKERKRQIDILLSYSEANNAIPLYCFYNYVNHTDEELLHFWRADFPFNKKQFGWTYIPAHYIRYILDTEIKKTHFRFFDYIHSFSETFPMKSLILQNFNEHSMNYKYFNESPKNGYFRYLPEHLKISDTKMVSEGSVSYVIDPQRYVDPKNTIEYREAYPKECYDNELQKFPKQVLIIDTNK